MKLIPLTRNKFAMVDNDDYEMLIKFNWCAGSGRHTDYACCKHRSVYMHRLIANAPKGLNVDHVDGNGLNNQKSNLRIVTIRQNLQNMHIQKSSKYPGVKFNKRSNNWCSLIRIGGSRINLGYFTDEFAAFQAYVVANAVMVIYPPANQPQCQRKDVGAYDGAR